jgi:hypothetical protein
LISTLVVYLGPLIYIKNKDVIDAHLKNAGDMVNQQATQIKDLAAQHTKGATETISTYAGEYTKKAQDLVGQSRQKIPEVTGTNGSVNTAKVPDYPSVPKEAPVAHAEVPEAQPVAILE